MLLCVVEPAGSHVSLPDVVLDLLLPRVVDVARRLHRWRWKICIPPGLRGIRGKDLVWLLWGKLRVHTVFWSVGGAV